MKNNNLINKWFSKIYDLTYNHELPEKYDKRIAKLWLRFSRYIVMKIGVKNKKMQYYFCHSILATIAHAIESDVSINGEHYTKEQVVRLVSIYMSVVEIDAKIYDLFLGSDLKYSKRIDSILKAALE